MTVTIRDVAAKAGVSIATVSRALRGHTNISLNTREHVAEVALSLGYELPERSKSVAKPQAKRVAIVVPFIGRWYFARIIEGIELILSERGYESVLFRPSDSSGREVNWAEHLDHYGIQGAIIVTEVVRDSALQSLIQRQIPLVLIDTSARGYTDIGIDDVEVGRIATSHLLELGHRRIALVTGNPNDPMRFSTPSARQKGYEQKLLEFGLRPDPRFIVPADFTPRGAYQAALQVLSLPDRPTAVFAASDEMALGVIGAAQLLGLRVPEDLSVIGVDDHEVAEVMGVTTVAQPVDTIAEIAAWQLISRMSDVDKSPPARVLLPVQLVVRKTTAQNQD